MQKRVIGYIDGLAAESYTSRNTTAAAKTANKTAATSAAKATGEAKTAKTRGGKSSFGKAVKFAVVCMLLVFSVFCAIGSADWIISQQVKFESSSESESYFNFDEAALQAHINIKAGEATTQSQSARAQKAAKNTAGVSTAKAATNYSAKTSSASPLYAANDENAATYANDENGAATYANESETSSQIGRATYNGAPLEAFVVTSGVANAAGELPEKAITSALTTKYVELNSESEKLPAKIEDYFANATEGMPSAAGTYAIYVTINGFKDLGFAVKIFTITPCPVAITWSGSTLKGFTYDGAVHTDVKATATVNTSESGNTIGAQANVTVEYDITRKVKNETVPANEIKNAGAYTLTAKLTGDNAGNYTITSGETTKTASFTVAKAALTVTANNKQITYGDNQPSFSVSYSGFVNGEDSSVLSGSVDFACGYERGSDVDTYDIDITSSGLTSENYAITFKTGTLTVKPYGVKIEWSKTTVTYNGEAQSPTAEISNKIADLPAPELTLSPASATEAGTHTVTASLTGKNADNYTIASGETTTFTINKKAIEITITEKSIVYGTAVPTKFDYKIDESSLEDKITVSFDTTCKGAVGTYDVTATISFKQGYESLKDNYSFEIDGSGKLKVTPALLTVKAKDLSIAYGSDKPSFEVEYTGFVNGEDSSVLKGTVAFACEYSKGSDVRTYTITPSGLSSENYDITFDNGTLTVKPYGLIITWTNTELTYDGTPKKPTATISNPISGLTMPAITVSGSTTDAGEYEASARVDDGNYTIASGGTTEFTIKGIKVNIANLIEKDYSAGGITFNASLLTGLFTTESGTVLSADEIAKIFTINLNGAKAKNFSDDTATASETAGLFSYEPDEIIKAGSTYLISGIEITAKNKNYTISNTKPNIYLKYKTAKVGSTYYTIEDALSQSGDITLAGDSSSAKSYVITAFSKLGLQDSSNFKSYKNDYQYALSGKQLIVSYNDSGTIVTYNKADYKTGYVYSALVLHGNINFTVSGNGTKLITAANIAYYNNTLTTAAMARGVILNNGIITLKDKAKIESYGYIKGTGQITLEKGTTAVDAMSIYDWPGGTAASSMYEEVFPTNAYTLHNISCKTRIDGGAYYTAKVYVYMKTTKFGVTLDKEVNVEQTIVGDTSNKGLFNLTNSTDTTSYLIKTASTSSNFNINDIKTSNQNFSQPIKHRDVIETYGNYIDNSISITIEVPVLENPVLKNDLSKPLPIGLMDVTIASGTLTLQASDYTILPGSTITVTEQGTLVLGSGVDLVAMPISEMPTKGNPSGNDNTRSYYTYCNYTAEGKIIINGKLEGSGNLGGNILTGAEGATLTVANNSGTYKTLCSTNSPYYKSGTINATGDIITGLNDTHEESTLSAGTYYSRELSDGTFVWFKNTATITYVLNGGKVGETTGTYTKTINLSADGFNPNETNSGYYVKPDRNYYTFGGWYSDSACTDGNEVNEIFADCTLYAKWNAISYTIKYEGSIQYSLPENVKTQISGDEVYTLPTPENIAEGYFFKGWSFTKDDSTNLITSISAANANNGIITVYAILSSEIQYTIEFLNEKGEKIEEFTVKPKTNLSDFKYSDLPDTGTTDTDTSIPRIFAGFYKDIAYTELFTDGGDFGSLSHDDYTYYLYVKWNYKAAITIEYYNGSEMKTLDTKYYNSADSISLTAAELGISTNSYRIVGITTSNATNVAVTGNAHTNLDGVTIKVDSVTAIQAKDGATAPSANVTVDVRRIFEVNISMSAEAYHKGTFNTYTKNFEINSLKLSGGQYYSTDTSKTTWQPINNISYNKTGTTILYLLSGSLNETSFNHSDTIIEVSINDVKPSWGSNTRINNPKTNEFVQYSSNLSQSPATFKFTIKGNSTITWSDSIPD